MIPVQEGLELLIEIYDILDNALSKWVENTVHIWASLFNSASRQCHDVWASQNHFVHIFKDSAPPSEVYLYGHINWYLAQVQQQSSLGLAQSTRWGRTRPRTDF